MISQRSMASNCQQVQCKLIAIIDVRLGYKGGGGGGHDLYTRLATQ